MPTKDYDARFLVGRYSTHSLCRRMIGRQIVTNAWRVMYRLRRASNDGKSPGKRLISLAEIDHIR